METDENKVEETPRKDLRAALAALPSFEEEPLQDDGAATVGNDTPVEKTQVTEEEGVQPSEVGEQDVPEAGQSETLVVPDIAMADQNVPSETGSPDGASADNGPAAAQGPRRWPLVAGGVACAAALVYAGGALYFSGHFMPSTTVNGNDVSWMAVNELATSVTQLGLSYQTHIVGDGIDITVPGADIDVSYDGTAYAQEAAQQVPAWSWPFEVAKDHAYTVHEGIAFNADKLNEALGAAIDQVNAGATPPTNATVGFSDEEQRFVVVPEVMGTAVDRDAVLQAASTGVTNLQEEITLGETELQQPGIKSDDERLATARDKANQLLDAPLVLRLQGDKTETLGPAQLGAWVQINAEDCSLGFNRDAVVAWGRDDLSKRYDSVGTARHYQRADGKEVDVEGGDYGWCIDSEALADQIIERLAAANSEPLDVPMKSTAAQVNPGGADWPARYIDVDISEQYMRVYGDDGQIVLESSVVTGNPSHPTDQGVYAIFEHSTNVTLVGLDYNGDNQPDYRTPVTYWMPFNGGMGLHDAYWRGAFGGNIYQYDGSHGCVNLPSGVAQQLFDWSHVGDVVVVHY